VVVAVDFSTCSAAASRAALRLARAFGARLTFLHVIAPLAVDPEVVLNWGDFPERRRAAAESQLREWRLEQTGGFAADDEVLEGRPGDVLVRRVTELAADLLVLGRRGQTSGALAGEQLGSTAARVLRHAVCPVWVTGDDGETEGLKQLVLATDYSPAAEVAVPVAAGLAAFFGARLTVVNVQEPMALPGQLEYQRHGAEIEVRRERAAAELDVWRARHLAAAADGAAEALEGAAAPALCRAARRLRADLVVLASRGRTGWLRVLLGSTAERVAEHAPCAVLVVPAALPVEAVDAD
jgi:nucleotide-binding universal stress UspA family protein